MAIGRSTGPAEQVHWFCRVTVQSDGASAAPYVNSEWNDVDHDPSKRQSPVMAEYEARRCHICCSKYPPFGFGPPLIKKGSAVWACRDHRMEVYRLLTVEPAPRGDHSQQVLL